MIEIIEHSSSLFRFDIANMANGAASCSDEVVFVCKDDGNRVYSSRNFLADKSDVFKAMLTNGMLESTQLVIRLPIIHSVALQSLINFFNNEKLVWREVSRDFRWEFNFELISASQFFQVSNLEGKTFWDDVEKLATVLLRNASDPAAQAAFMLTVVMKFNTTLRGLNDEWVGDNARMGNVILSKLINKLSSKITQLDIRLLSEDALKYFLHKSKSVSEEKRTDAEITKLRKGLGVRKRDSFFEYNRLKQVISWCSYRNCVDWYKYGEESRRMVEVVVPDERKMLSSRQVSIVNRMNDAEVGHEKSRIMDVILPDQTSRVHASKLLSMINLCQIHHELLLQVIVPLGRFAQADIEKAMNFHTLRVGPMFTLSSSDVAWEHDGDYYVHTHGLAIRVRTPRLPYQVPEPLCHVNHKWCFATANLPMSAGKPCVRGFYEWYFTMEDVGRETDFCELGFIQRMKGFTLHSPGLVNQSAIALGFASPDHVIGKLSDHPNARWVTSTHCELRGMSEHLSSSDYENHEAFRSGKIEMKPGSLLKFHLDPMKGTCSVTLDSTELGILWSQLPNATFFPAVCIGGQDCQYQNVRLKLGNGFL